MNDEALQTGSMHRLIERIHEGDRQAEDELIRRVVGRLERLTRKMLQSFPHVNQWEQAGDVLQNALMRLLRTLAKLKPENTRAFFGLATEHLRRELLDLNRHYQGAYGLGKNQSVRDFAAPDASGRGHYQPADSSPELEQLERWQAFHEAVERLPAEEREVFSLVFYHGWTQVQIAELLQVHERTVRRQWGSACVHLSDMLGSDLPVD
jgi:RNA polymerase sigma-70 factor (ECF subfamily)